jgi:hypothetical protein
MYGSAFKQDETNICLSDRLRYPFQQRRAIRRPDECLMVNDEW